MLEATWWGFVGGTALLLGAVCGIFLPLSHRFIGLVLGFGTGVLVSALAFELVGEAYDSAGAPATVSGLLAGSLVFSPATGGSTRVGDTDARAPEELHPVRHPLPSCWVPCSTASRSRPRSASA